MLQLESVSAYGPNMLKVRLSSTEPYDGTIVEHKEMKVSDYGDVLFYNRHKDGTYSYGLIQGDYERYGHCKGYVWSSRGSVINKFFGLNLIDTAVYYDDSITAISLAVDKDVMKELLTSDFKVVEHICDDGEACYKVECAGDKKVKCDDVLYKRGSNGSALSPSYNMTTIILNNANNN